MARNHYRKQARHRDTPHCPNCGGIARETVTTFGVRSQCCGLWSWDRYPLVDAETHAARGRAHAAFDPLWRKGGMSRAAAYRALSRELGLTKDECHMKLMDKSTASRVPDACESIRAALRSTREGG